MSTKSTNFLMLITGIAAGAALGILFAPKKGSDTRNDLVKKGEDLYDRLKDLVTEAKEQVAEKADRVKEKVNEVKNEAQRHADSVRNAAKA